jgi:hypothetical protein
MAKPNQAGIIIRASGRDPLLEHSGGHLNTDAWFARRNHWLHFIGEGADGPYRTHGRRQDWQLAMAIADDERVDLLFGAQIDDKFATIALTDRRLLARAAPARLDV